MVCIKSRATLLMATLSAAEQRPVTEVAAEATRCIEPDVMLFRSRMLVLAAGCQHHFYSCDRYFLGRWIICSR